METLQNTSNLIDKYTDLLVNKLRKEGYSISDDNKGFFTKQKYREMFVKHVDNSKNVQYILDLLLSNDNIISRKFFSELLNINLSSKQSERLSQIKSHFNYKEIKKEVPKVSELDRLGSLKTLNKKYKFADGNVRSIKEQISKMMDNGAILKNNELYYSDMTNEFIFLNKTEAKYAQILFKKSSKIA
jgi:hypothetical protein